MKTQLPKDVSALMRKLIAFVFTKLFQKPFEEKIIETTIARKIGFGFLKILVQKSAFYWFSDQYAKRSIIRDICFFSEPIKTEHSIGGE